jgi:FAD/FMN-containing dehydrogenase/SAM-dependent methyltransferase
MTETPTFAPAQYKANLRTEWRDAAPGWRAWVDVLEAANGGQAVSRSLVQLAAIGPGDAVLDVAAGYGEPSLTAAHAVAPDGHVVCTDISAAMLALGRERAAAAGLDNLEFLEGDAEELAFEEASFDAVLSRQGLQYLPDVAGVLTRLRSFLKPHGRLAAAVWGPPGTVQFAAPVPLIRAELGLPPPPAGIPGPFALADADQLVGLVEAAGFGDVATGTVTAIYELGSPELATRWLREVAPPISSLVDGQPAKVQERVWAKVTEAWAPYTTTDGRVRLENQAVWVIGTKVDGPEEGHQMTTTSIDLAGLDGGLVTLTPEQLDDLDSQVVGRLLRAGDDGWDDPLLIWNGMAAEVPALVVQPTSAHDVAAAVGFARDHRLLLSVKGGGHNIAGTAIAEGGLTLDLSRMRHIDVDPEAKLAHVGPGCLLADVDQATQQHGLATPLGFISEVGVAGLTLGGGLGYLTRRFGWTVDNLEEVEIVTADSRIRRASREENPDLFWAIRGAGANLGVVTRFTLRLHQIGPTVYGGLVAWPFERAEEILQAYRTITTQAPRELAVWLILLNAPAAPFVPEPWHGRRICAMAVCYSGDLDEANHALAPIRALGDPVVDLLGEQPYTRVQSYLDATEPKGLHYYWKTEYLAELSDDLLSTTRELAAECPIPEAEIGFLHLGGALNDHDGDDGAVGNRDARFVLGVNGMWTPDEPDADNFRRWIRDAWERVRAFSTGATYINFQTADEDQERIRGFYGANFDRLVEVKQHYDPHNLFRANRNIRPQAASERRPGS